MEILPLLIGISIVAVVAIAGVFVWAVRSGQFDDLDTPAVRILVDEDDPPPSGLTESRCRNGNASHKK